MLKNRYLHISCVRFVTFSAEVLLLCELGRSQPRLTRSVVCLYRSSVIQMSSKQLPLDPNSARDSWQHIVMEKEVVQICWSKGIWMSWLMGTCPGWKDFIVTKRWQERLVINPLGLSTGWMEQLHHCRHGDRRNCDVSFLCECWCCRIAHIV